MTQFIEAGGGCMANDPAYWRASRTDSEGSCILACGETAEIAEAKATNLLNEREVFLNKSAREQLNEIASKEHILSLDLERAVRLINKLLN